MPFSGDQFPIFRYTEPSDIPFLISSHDILPGFWWLLSIVSHRYRCLFTVLRLETHGEGARVFQGPWATTALAAPLGDVQSWCSAGGGLMDGDGWRCICLSLFFKCVHNKKLLIIDNIEHRGVWYFKFDSHRGVWYFKLNSHCLFEESNCLCPEAGRNLFTCVSCGITQDHWADSAVRHRPSAERNM